jgi:hypothetical protein
MFVFVQAYEIPNFKKLKNWTENKSCCCEEWRHLTAEPHFAGQDFTRVSPKPVYGSGQVSSVLINILVILFDLK